MIAEDGGDEDLGIPEDVQAAIETAPELRSLGQWRSLAQHLEAELIRHTAAMSETASETARAAEEARIQWAASERKNRAYQVFLSELEEMIVHGRLVPARPKRSGHHERRSWARLVEDAEQSLIEVAGTPQGVEALRRLRKHDLFLRSKASVPSQKGELASRLHRERLARTTLALGSMAHQVPKAKPRGRPRKDDDFPGRLLRLIEQKFPDVHEERALSRVIRNFVRKQAKKAAEAGAVAPLRADQVEAEAKRLTQAVRDAKKLRDKSRG